MLQSKHQQAKVVEIPVPKKAETPAPKTVEIPAPKPTENPAPKQTETPAPEIKQAETAPIESNSANEMKAKLTKEQCIAKASKFVGAGGQAKGEAKNVTAKQVTGGGTIYYTVELDLGEVHYTVNVDAIDGGIINADCTHNGVRTLLDKEGNPIPGTEQTVDKKVSEKSAEKPVETPAENVEA